ncbi:amidase domain-containing protein [Agromyces marinus]|uniref:IPT/TIG domain-containing protein n=1 Tax=Agromyces marinus TaxID=1389020 RepID=A0ABN6YBB6_9MICO|nr:amidase domain-containing protein [Agromyces marinus]UIP57405.1 hypothetical protein DSM26151_02600 [Agromyces marinus]BDZ54478.1 hypothetical protein GCM10025870_15510 [Agromyces marinus]
MPKLPFLPGARRATYRAPDPETAREFDLNLRSTETATVEDAAVPVTASLADDAPRPTVSRSTFAPTDRPGPGLDQTPAGDDAPSGGDASAGGDAPAALPDPEPDFAPDLDAIRNPRHRVDRRGNRRASSTGRRSLVVASAAFLLGSAVAAGVAVGDLGGATDAEASARDAALADATGSDGADDVVVPPAASDARPVVTSELSAAEAPFTGGTLVTVEGRNLDHVSEVTVAGSPAQLVESSPSAVTFAVPAVDDAVRGDAVVVLAGADGSAVDVEVPVASAPAAAPTSVQGIIEASAPTEADRIDRTPLSITYTADPGIDAQVAYVLAHWSDYNTAEYAVLSGVDCANFASQSLIARGWTMDAAWNYDRGTGQMTSAWSSSTALRDYLRTRTDVATELTDAQRGEVKVGDVAQFDWDGSGDRDHTAVVTRVEHTDQGTKVWVGGHTKDADYWDVDVALASGGGSVSYFSLS